MPIVREQDVWKTGSRVYVQEVEPNGPLYDLGTISVVTPATETEDIRLEDSDGGIKRTIVREIVKFTERYEVTMFNLNMRNLRYLFYAESQNALAMTTAAVTHNNFPFWPGQKVKIKDANGVPAYNLAAVTLVRNGAGSTATSGSDFTVDLARGIVTVAGTTSAVATSAVTAVVGAGTLAPGAAGTIQFAGASTGSELRIMSPQTKVGQFEGKIYVVWGRTGNQEQTVREFNGSIIPAAGAFSDSEYSQFPVTIEVTYDPTATSEPAGRLVYFKGGIPSSPSAQ